MPERKEPERDEEERQKEDMAACHGEDDQRNRHTYRKRPQHLGPPSSRRRCYMHRQPLAKHRCHAADGLRP
jgi:hypothetical protein